MRICFLSVVIVLLIVIGCSSPDKQREFVVEPVNGISFKFEILEMHGPSVTKNKPENLYQSMNYRLTLTNNTKQEIYFNPGDVIVRVNGVDNLYTGPQSLGSGEWRTEAYPPGSTSFHSFTYFPEELLHLKVKDIRTFSLVSNGLENPP